MKLDGKVALVTGGAHGIGRALVERFAAEGARLAVTDLDGEAAASLADAVGGLGLAVDVSSEAEIRRAVAQTEERLGPIDLLCSNAGVMFTDRPGWTAVSQSDEQWDRVWKVNVMAHVWGARAVLPGMIDRGGGYLLHTVSAAGLLSQIGDAAYSTSKHAAIGFAESLVITHGEQGIKVSVLCPQAVATDILRGKMDEPPAKAAMADGVLSPAEVAEATVRGLAEERFLILPHPQVSDYIRHKANDYDRWLAAMRRFRRTLWPDDAMMELPR
jgi:NAD(P)-dependent dehydrogenase (short-subunit alcohol dehydrogenase family)